MTSFDWESFLKRWSQEILESMGSDRHKLPPEAIASGWLGYPGASDAQIAEAEQRLNTTLPPSYRAFLKVSNGWRQTTPFISKLWSVAELEWFAVRNQNWLDALLAKSELAKSDRAVVSKNDNIPPASVPDEEYFIYGDEQDCSKIRVEYLSSALEISQRGEAAIYLLNPQVVTADGEWEAWFLGDWLPGADRYRSFQEMMQAEYESFLELREIPVRAIAPFPQSADLSPDTDSPSATPSSALHEAIEAVVHPSAEPNSLANAAEQSPLDDERWETCNRFTVEFQSQANAAEQRVIIRHVETGAVLTCADLEADIFQQWIPAQLNAMTEPTVTESAHLEITQLRLIRTSRFETVMTADAAHPLFLDVLEPGEPFTLEVSMRATETAIAPLLQFSLTQASLIFRSQCFAYHLSTHHHLCLGDIVVTTPIQPDSVYTILFPEMSLPQPGSYRLKVWVSLQNAAVTPGYFKVPLLQVV